MGSVILKGLKFHSLHGYHDFEREKGNDFEVDLIFEVDFLDAAKNDDLAKTIDYTLAAAVVSKVMDGPPRKLIETLCWEMGTRLYESVKNVTSIEVCIRKLSPPADFLADWAEVREIWRK